MTLNNSSKHSLSTINQNNLTIFKSNNDLLKGFTFPNIDLLYFSDKNADDIIIGETLNIKIFLFEDKVTYDSIDIVDASTIFIKLPIQKASLNEKYEPLGYFPSYQRLTPKQRWIYLKWLQDVREEIDVGYIFIYYYGLERHLLMGNFDLAFDEVLKLRQFHKHPSFLDYSESALVNASLINKRVDKLEILAKNGINIDFNNVFFMLAFKIKHDLSSDNLMIIFKNVSGLNKRYFKENESKFRDFLSEVLIEKFKKPLFPFPNDYKLEEISRASYPLFANYSLPDDLRAPDIPEFYKYNRLLDDLKEVFSLTHEKYKVSKMRERKKPCK